MSNDSTVGTYKISSTGWLCKLIDGKWIPLTKLTEQQLEDCK